jgi:hypothetical protein
VTTNYHNYPFSSPLHYVCMELTHFLTPLSPSSGGTGHSRHRSSIRRARCPPHRPPPPPPCGHNLARTPPLFGGRSSSCRATSDGAGNARGGSFSGGWRRRQSASVVPRRGWPRPGRPRSATTPSATPRTLMMAPCRPALPPSSLPVPPINKSIHN